MVTTDAEDLDIADHSDAVPGPDDAVSVLWLTPDKPANISIGRQRIAAHLEQAGFDLTLRGTTGRAVLASLRERGQYDVVVGTTRAGAIAASLVAGLHGRPLVVDHVDPIRQLRETASWPVASAVERLENTAFRLADHVLYVYAEEADRVTRRAGMVTRTNLGVDIERFADPNEEAIADARQRLDDVEDDVAVYVGGLEPIYAVEPLLASVEHLQDWTLVIAGAGSLEPVVDQAAAQTDSIRFLGTVTHETIPGLLALADVGVSLVDDPYTLKVLEYGASGLPVVQRAGRAESRFGDRVEYATADPASVADAIECAKAAGGGRLREFVAQFDWQRIAADYRSAIVTVA